VRTLLPAVFTVASFCVSSSAQELSQGDQAAADAAVKIIRPEAIAARMRLSDDLLEGRQTGVRGHEIAARYVAAKLASMGLAPAGVNDTWFPPVALRKVDLVPDRPRSNLYATAKCRRWYSRLEIKPFQCV
jgi:hypothetical protein